MTSGVSIIGSTQGATPFVAVAPAATQAAGFASSLSSSSSAAAVSAPAATQAAGFASSLSSSSSAAAVSAPLRNQRVIDDPSAGAITEYLSSNGGLVVAQSPSAVTVAYLRQGLTATGLTKAQVQAEELQHSSVTA